MFSVLSKAVLSDECSEAVDLGNEHRSVSFHTPIGFLELCDDSSMITGKDTLSMSLLERKIYKKCIVFHIEGELFQMVSI